MLYDLSLAFRVSEKRDFIDSFAVDIDEKDRDMFDIFGMNIEVVLRFFASLLITEFFGSLSLRISQRT